MAIRATLFSSSTKYGQQARFLIAIVGGILALVGYYSTTFQNWRGWAYNSDLLYLPALYDDIVRSVRPLDWKLPPAPYFFPDMPLFFAIRAISANVHVAIYGYGIAQIVGFTLGLALLARRILPDRYGQDRYTLIILMAILFLFSDRFLNSFTRSIFVSSHHFGTMLVLPYILTLSSMILLKEHTHPIYYVVLFFLSFLISASDGISVVQISLPLCFALIVIFLVGKTTFKDVFPLVGVLIISVLSGVAFCQLVMKYKSLYLMLGLFYFPGFIDAIRFFASRNSVHVAIVAIFLAMCVFALISGLSRTSPCQDEKNEVIFLLFPLFFLLSFVISVPSVIISGVVLDHSMFRYFLPFLMFPVFWGFPFVISCFTSIREFVFRPVVVFLTAIIVFLLSSVGLNIRAIEHLVSNIDYYPPLVRCIDENAASLKIRNGISQYWQAKHISLLSKNDLRVVQVYRDLSPQHWINNLTWYRIQPEFAVIDMSLPDDDPYRLDQELIIDRYGDPASIFQCGDSKVLVYNRPEDREFRELFQRSPTLARIEKVGDAFEFYAAYLPSRTGIVRGLSRIADHSSAEFLSFGPYISLPAGDYYFQIHYLAQNEQMAVGFWDVAVSRSSDLEIIASGDILSEEKIVANSFRLEKPGVVQIRVFYLGDGYLKLDRIYLEKTG